MTPRKQSPDSIKQFLGDSLFLAEFNCFIAWRSFSISWSDGLPEQEDEKSLLEEESHERDFSKITGDGS